MKSWINQWITGHQSVHTRLEESRLSCLPDGRPKASTLLQVGLGGRSIYTERRRRRRQSDLRTAANCQKRQTGRRATTSWKLPTVRHSRIGAAESFHRFRRGASSLFGKHDRWCQSCRRRSQPETQSGRVRAIAVEHHQRTRSAASQLGSDRDLRSTTGDGTADPIFSARQHIARYAIARPSIRPSVGWIIQNRKFGLWNL